MQRTGVALVSRCIVNVATSVFSRVLPFVRARAGLRIEAVAHPAFCSLIEAVVSGRCFICCIATWL